MYNKHKRKKKNVYYHVNFFKWQFQSVDWWGWGNYACTTLHKGV